MTPDQSKVPVVGDAIVNAPRAPLDPFRRPPTQEHTQTIPPHILSSPSTLTSLPFSETFDRRAALVDPGPVQSACRGGCYRERPEGTPGPISTTPDPRTHTYHSQGILYSPSTLTRAPFSETFDRRVAPVGPRPLESACGRVCYRERPEGAPGPISTAPDLRTHKKHPPTHPLQP